MNLKFSTAVWMIHETVLWVELFTTCQVVGGCYWVWLINHLKVMVNQWLSLGSVGKAHRCHKGSIFQWLLLLLQRRNDPSQAKGIFWSHIPFKQRWHRTGHGRVISIGSCLCLLFSLTAATDLTLKVPTTIPSSCKIPPFQLHFCSILQRTRREVKAGTSTGCQQSFLGLPSHVVLFCPFGKYPEKKS